MSEPTLQLAGLGTLAALTLAVATRLGAWPRDRKTLAHRGGQLLVALLAAALALPGLMHNCDLGNPDHLLLLCLAGPLVLAVRCRRWLVFGLALPTLLVGALALGLRYVSLVHGTEWVGRAMPDRSDVELERSHAAEALAQLRDARLERLPEGFVEDALPATAPHLEHLVLLGRESTSEWHTPLSRLWRRSRVQHHLWSPGGKLADLEGRLVYRSRPLRPRGR